MPSSAGPGNEAFKDMDSALTLFELGFTTLPPTRGESEPYSYLRKLRVWMDLGVKENFVQILILLLNSRASLNESLNLLEARAGKTWGPVKE